MGASVAAGAASSRNSATLFGVLSSPFDRLRTMIATATATTAASQQSIITINERLFCSEVGECMIRTVRNELGALSCLGHGFVPVWAFLFVPVWARFAPVPTMQLLTMDFVIANTDVTFYEE